MKQALVIILSLVALAASPAWHKGTLIDVQRYGTHAGKFRAQSSYCLSLQLDDTVYLARYEPVWRGAYNPARLVIGDAVEASIDGDHLFIRTSPSQIVKTSIDRREKASGHPTTCAERVQD